MPVQPAMGKTGGRHQFGHTDPIESSLSKQSRGGFQNLFAVFGGLFSADLHGVSGFLARSSCLTIDAAINIIFLIAVAIINVSEMANQG